MIRALLALSLALAAVDTGGVPLSALQLARAPVAAARWVAPPVRVVVVRRR